MRLFTTIGGCLVAAISFAGCACPKPPPVAAPLCPEVSAPKCPEQKTKVVHIKRKCPSCPERPRPAPAARVIIRDRAAPKTCAYGKVITTGHMVLVVQRAQVTVASKTATSSSYTDNNGVFVVCLDSSELQRGEKLTISVSKPPFVPAEQTLDAEAGNHFEILFRLRAPGLTD